MFIYFLECIFENTFYLFLLLILYCISFAIFLYLTQPDYTLLISWIFLCLIGLAIGILGCIANMVLWLYDVIFGKDD